jgi:uncharacterized protein DUF1553/uncharacterized protein DUF1549
MPRLAILTLLLLVPAVAAEEPHWAFQPVKRPTVPEIRNPKYEIRNTIDRFILTRLQEKGLSFAPEADRRTLIRRVKFDLLGLPPTPEEVEAFVNDKSPDAYEKLVDRYLANPHYGERWARHWLDLARYADTNGYEFDEPRPDAWRYRDYVIRSFNNDKPFDRFILEQIAGDEAFPGDRDALIATGFNLLGPDMTDASDQAQRRTNTLNDMTDTTALAFLGLTMTCARCHDHKFEPIPQKDYFRLQAFFTPAAFRRDLPIATPEEAKARAEKQREYDEATKDIFEQIASVELPHREKLYEARLARLSAEAQEAHRTAPEKRTGGQQELVAQTARLLVVSDAEVAKLLNDDDKAMLKLLKNFITAFESKKPPPAPVAIGLTDARGAPPKTYLLERGEIANRGAEVEPGFPAIVSPGGKAVDAPIAALPSSTGRRLALAKWIASKENPLTARVIVNRLWQHHFGKAIVATASDFGLRGERPTHPELLDWLASELVDGGWKLKRIHKLILSSAAYRQSTQASKEALAEDPDNELLSRQNRRRLEGEAVRDSLLAVSGKLNPKMGGPGVVLPELSKPAGGSKPVPVTRDAAEYDRRSIYLFSRRNLRYAFLEAFDLPDSNLSCPRRERSTTAPQALALLNSPEAIAAAKVFAERVEKEAKSETERIDRAYRLALGRPPTAKEQERAQAFLKESPLSELCRALVNLNEFVYLD